VIWGEGIRIVMGARGSRRRRKGLWRRYYRASMTWRRRLNASSTEAVLRSLGRPIPKEPTVSSSSSADGSSHNLWVIREGLSLRD